MVYLSSLNVMKIISLVVLATEQLLGWTCDKFVYEETIGQKTNKYTMWVRYVKSPKYPASRQPVKEVLIHVFQLQQCPSQIKTKLFYNSTSVAIRFQSDMKCGDITLCWDHIMITII